MKDSNELKLHYHHWANMKLLHYINGLESDVFLKEVKSIFPSLAGIFEHIYSVDLMWAKRILGESQPVIEKIKFETSTKASQHFEQLFFQYQKFSYKEERIVYQNSKDERFENEIHEIIGHIMNHGTYHRGNISAVLHQLGEKSISTDFIFFLREVKN